MSSRLPAIGASGGAIKISPIRAALILPVALSGLVDLPVQVNLGPTSALATLTGLYVALAGLLWLARPVITLKSLPVVAPLAAFLVWGAASFFWYAPTLPGFQNLLVVTAFLAIILFTSSSLSSEEQLGLVEKTLACATWVAVGLYGLDLLMGGWGSEILLGPRSFALFALLGIAWYLSAWRYGMRRGLLWAMVIIAMIGASLSRMAMVVAILLLPLSLVPARGVKGWVRVVVSIAAMVGISYLALTYVEPLRARFLEASATEVGGIAINASGRADFWSVTLDSWKQSPWIGNGAGSAEEVMVAWFPMTASHPHNDYLRVLHDYGVVGLTLWATAFFNMLLTTFRSWVVADREGRPDSALHLTAFLSVVAIALAMITDNVMVYIFAMAPLGVLVGVSLSNKEEIAS